jgi:hypothetical protein
MAAALRAAFGSRCHSEERFVLRAAKNRDEESAVCFVRARLFILSAFMRRAAVPKGEWVAGFSR